MIKFKVVHIILEKHSLKKLRFIIIYCKNWSNSYGEKKFYFFFLILLVSACFCVLQVQEKKVGQNKEINSEKLCEKITGLLFEG